MECNILKKDYYFTKTALDGFGEDKIDFDIIIPDYCVPAMKILKCNVSPVVVSKKIEDDKLTVEGMCYVNIIYLDEDTGCLRSISDSEAFVQTHTIKEKLENYRIKVKVRPSNVVCRLQNSRRISVKAILGMAVKVIGTSCSELIYEFEDCQIESKFDNNVCMLYLGSGESDVRVNAEIAIEGQALDVINTDVRFLISDTKVINDRVIVKGEAVLNCVYTCGDTVDDIKNAAQSIPFSEIIEIEGISENDFCDINCELINMRCSIDGAENQNIITVEIEALAEAAVYTEKHISLLKDVYSKKSNMELKYSNIFIESLSKNMSFSKKLCEVIELNSEDAIIDSVIVKPLIKNISFNDGNLIIEGENCFSILIHNSEECSNIEKTLPFSVSEHLNDLYTELRCEAEVTCIEANASVKNNTIETECDFKFDILLFSKEHKEYVSGITVVQSEELRRTPGIILYYADKGEALWDIAKNHLTSIETIKKDNNLESEYIDEKCMLLISGN